MNSFIFEANNSGGMEETVESSYFFPTCQKVDIITIPQSISYYNGGYSVGRPEQAFSIILVSFGHYGAKHRLMKVYQMHFFT